jgi:menaquinone-dependent protoporphyrinogen oxidase
LELIESPSIYKKGEAMIEYLSRREFMSRSAMLAGGALGTLTVGRDLIGPREVRAGEVQFIETRCGENGKKDRILIAYASQCGSTGGVADAIGRVFCEKGASVDVLRVGNVRDLTSYCAVVVGSAIHSDQWLSEASDFVIRNREVLSRLPVAYFLTCLTLARPTEENRLKALRFLDPLHRDAPQVTPIETGLFAGVLDYDKLSFMVRMVMKIKMKDKGVDEGDYRDWSSIRSWASSVAPRLLNGGRTSA